MWSHDGHTDELTAMLRTIRPTWRVAHWDGNNSDNRREVGYYIRVISSGTVISMIGITSDEAYDRLSWYARGWRDANRHSGESTNG